MLLWWRMDFKGVFECLYTAGLVEKNNTAEEKLLCLYRQVFKVVKIAECQVRTCTKKKVGESFQAHTHTSCKNNKGGKYLLLNHSLLYYQILTATKNFSPL